MKKFTDCAVVWQIHYMSDRVRAAIDRQRGEKNNYIVICCSPSFTGIYTYPSELTQTFEIIDNNGKKCYDIPFTCLKKMGELTAIKHPDLIKEVKKAQAKWFEFSGNKKKPDWFLK